MATLPPFLDGVEVRPAQGKALDYKVSFGISSLDKDLHRTAARIHLIRNGDGDAQTLSIADIDATKDVEGFTSQDRNEMASIRDVLVDKLNRKPTTIKPVVSVPAPGVTKVPCPHYGSTPVYLNSTIQYTERRQLQVQASEFTRTQESLEISRKLEALIDVPEGSQAVLRHPTRNDELMLEEGTQTVPENWHGEIRLEVWRDGTRVEHSNLNLPERVDSVEDFGEFLNYEMRSNGDPLPRRLSNRVDSTNPHSGGGMISYTFDLGWDPIGTEELPKEEAAAFGCAFPHLQPGSYRIQAWNEDVQVDLFPQGTVRVTLPDGEAVNLRPGQGGATPQFTGRSQGDGGFKGGHLRAGTNVAFISNNSVLKIGGQSFDISQDKRFA